MTATTPDADVLDREEAPVAAEAKAAPAPDTAEQLVLPGIAKATPQDLAEDAEQDGTEAKTPDASSFDPDFLSLDELLEQIKVKKPAIHESEIANIRNIFENIHNRTGGQLAIPRVAEGAALDNADLALELAGVSQLKPSTGFFKRAPELVFGKLADNGFAKINDKGVFFQAGKVEGSWFKKNAFTQEDARQIALLAMHNKDLLPPNAIKITGNKEQRAMIKAEIDKLNELLPDATKFKLTAKQSKEFAAVAPTPAAAPTAAAPASPVTDARLNALADTQNLKSFDDTDTKFDLAESISEVLNEDREGAIAGAKPIGTLAKFGHQAYESNFEDAGVNTTIQFADLGADRGLKVIRIEPTDEFPAYQSTPYVVLDRTDGVRTPDLHGEPVVKTPLAGNFDVAGKGAQPTQSHPDFVGPREFVGPPAPAARAPTAP